MLCYLSGEVKYRGDTYAILCTKDGVGYRVFLPSTLEARAGNSLEVYIHEVQREDGRELFGFETVDGLEFFWKLLSVSGIGPRSAQKIIAAAPVVEVRNKIMSEDVDFLTHIPGIGKKTAQKIILELKGVLAKEPVLSSADAEALEALTNLGYSRADALAVLSGGTGTAEERIRAALKQLSKAL